MAENVDSGVLGSQRTGELGAYRFSNLPVGRYTVAAQSVSSAPARPPGIEVNLNCATAAHIELAVGDVRTAVAIVAATAQIPRRLVNRSAFGRSHTAPAPTSRWTS